MGYDLQLRDVSVRYGGTLALAGADITIPEGQSLAIVGENGAGKSTMMKVISGVIPAGAYDGSVQLGGDPVRFGSVHDAQERGVVLIPQELQVARGLSIAENMFMGHLPKRGRVVVDQVRLQQESMRWLSFFEIEADPRSSIDVLAASEQRLAMIAAALSRDARILILDEPTAAFTDEETERLFTHVRKLRERGVTCLFITHRLDEIKAISERIVVLRNGELVQEFDSVASTTRADIVHAMIGRDLPDTADHGRQAPRTGKPVLTVRDLAVRRRTGRFESTIAENINLDLYPGEVVGLYGLVGAGRTEVASAIFGAWNDVVEGQVTLDGSELGTRSPSAAIRSGLAMLTEDRKKTGIIAGHSVRTNVSVVALPKSARFGVIDRTQEGSRVNNLVHSLDVRPPSTTLHIENLSGGNQQKVMLARWLDAEPKVLILDEPSIGVDIGARHDIHLWVRRLAAEGMAVLMISSDVDEVIEYCDRVLVMYKGHITEEFDGPPQRHVLVSASTGGADE
ncbi:MAG: sugar ABC transporter ATP-binding protein [Beutenbergiaceae bacterium]